MIATGLSGALLQAAVSVPKTEIDRRGAEYKRQRKAEKRARADK